MEHVNSSLVTTEQLIVSFVPELLREEYAKKPSRKPGDPIEVSQAALLWIDICEFSPMCNRLIEGSANGVESLTSILHEHYEYVLNMVSAHGGEPVMYAGDGILTAWSTKDEDLKTAVEHAATCAHAILDQRHVKNDQNETLSLHMVLACGTYQLIELSGVQKKWMYTITGTALSELILASKNRAPNELLMSQAAIALMDDKLNRKTVEYGASILQASPNSVALAKQHNVNLSEDAIQQIQSFVPQALSFPLNAERMKWLAELRPITVVFVQLPTHGFDLSTTVLRLRQALSITMATVTRMEGIVNQVWIDEKASNILVCFGPPPSSHADNPERGVRSALEVHATLRKINIECSIGITSGMAYCGILGNNTLRQYTVIGDAVNLASRIAGIKEGAIFVDKPTFTATQYAADFIGPVMSKLKGQANDVAVYHPMKLLASAKQKTGLQSIGREREIEQLVSHFDEVANGSIARTIMVEGDTGMGKSLLLADFKKQTVSHSRQIYATKADAIERLTPYRAWRDVIAALIGYEYSDHANQREETISALVDKYGSKACLLNIVLHLEIPESEEIRNMPASKRGQATQDFLLMIIDIAARTCPLAVIIDEAQWIDELSWDLLMVVNEKVANCLIILGIQNAEGHPQTEAMVAEGAPLISLQPLSDAVISKVIGTRLGVNTISEAVLRPIVNVAKGNPFFSVELAGSMLDQGHITIENDTCILAADIKAGNLTLPETVRGVLRMRVDAMGHGSQIAVKVGSVIGGKFETNLVRSIYPIESERGMVSSFLQEVNQFGLISPTVIETLEGYLFNNAATAEVVYEMTLAEQRKLLHQKSAEWYEENFSENLMPFFSQLAHHWEQAGNKIKACDYLEKEGARFIGMGYTKQAIELGLKGIAMFGVDVPTDPEKVGPLIGATMGYINAQMQGKNIPDLLHHKKLDNEEIERLIVMLTHVGPFCHIGGRLDLFVYLSLVGMKYTLDNGNGEYTGDVYSMYAIVYRAMTGDSQTAYQWSQLAVDVDKLMGGKLESRVGHVHCWFISHWVRPITESYAIALSAAAAGLAGGDVMFMCFNQAAHVVYMSFAGHPLEDVVKLGRKYYAINNLRVVNAAFHIKLEMQIAKALQGKTQGNTLLTDEEFDEDRDVAFIMNTDFTSQIGFYMVGKAKIAVHYGQWDEALQWTDNAGMYYQAMNGQMAESEYHFYGGMALLYAEAAETNAERKLALMERADASMQSMQQYAQVCPTNFQQKSLLLQAIKEALADNVGQAAMLFEQSAQTATANGFLNDCGLAYEHWLRMQHRLGERKSALAPSIDAWKRLGAYGKAAYLSIEFS